VIAKPSSCLTCPGWAWHGSGFMPSPEVPLQGTWNGVLLVGEALGEAEAASGKPFQGKAGWAFTQMLQRVGLDRGDFLIDNVLRCRPPDNRLNGIPLEREVIAHCGSHLNKTITEWKPRVIVPMGEVALQRILDLPKSEKITPRRGWVEWSHRYNCWVIPTFHPAFIMRGNQALSGVFVADVGYAVQVAQSGHKWNQCTYHTDPPLPLAEAWVRGFEEGGDDKLLAADIETPYKSEQEDEASLDFEDPSYVLLRVGFSWREGDALSLPWQTHYLPLIYRLLRSRAKKLWWNARYDVPRLIANNAAPGGSQWDLMWAWHIVNSDLPKGLSFVASLLAKGQPRWKHLGKSEPARYNAMDAEVTRRVGTKILADLTTHHLLDVFTRHIVKLDEILGAMSQAGLRIDHDARLALSQDVQAALASVKADLQEIVPFEAKDVFIYKVKPKDVSECVQVKTFAEVPRCSVCGHIKPTKPHFRLMKRRVNPCAGGSVISKTEEVERWAYVAPFVPSLPRMKAYQAIKGHKPRISKTKERRVTFDEGAIRDLRIAYPDDPLYPRIVEYREYEKIDGTYVGRWNDVAQRWEGGPPTDPQGVVHTTYSHEPSTLRLSSQAPNLQNIPRGSDSALQRRIKEMFVARPGHRLLEVDYKAIEAVLVGYFANDLSYVRLAKLGVHDYLNSHNLRRLGLLREAADIAWSDADLKGFFKELKRDFPDTYRNVAKGGPRAACGTPTLICSPR
jgi:uracil-DNA glycosylase family 4